MRYEDCLLVWYISGADTRQLFESTTDSVDAWNTHRDGLIKLVERLGPHQSADPVLRAVLVDIRGVEVRQRIKDAGHRRWVDGSEQVNATLPYSKSSTLGVLSWQLTHDPQTVIDWEHAFCDLALGLSALLEQDERLASSAQFDLRRPDGLFGSYTRTRLPHACAAGTHRSTEPSSG